MAQATKLGGGRLFTKANTKAYDSLKWVKRDSIITNPGTGKAVFEQRGVDFPEGWSLNAINIVAQKYFSGTPGTPERESSLQHLIDRVADTITRQGMQEGYFDDATETEDFREELKYVLATQRAAFNSPVWFNIGARERAQQASACFILHVDDTMPSILNWYTEEGMIFKGGSGSGLNISSIRSSKEALGKSAGTASGPLSFMRGADSSAGAIKSGGKTRRAAKMVILDVDHPDIEEFIWCKAIEERKARVLETAGFDMTLDGKDSFSVQYQNANNSVRVTDDFMRAVENDENWNLKAVTNGKTVQTVKARDLFRQISEAAWECADPGMQFDTTINKWHTTPVAGRINGSNPCSEYMHLDNSACNLSSINLLKYLNDDFSFDIEAFKHTVELMFTAQEILVGYSEYPTKNIGKNARAYRELGLGYANLGALLMAQGLPYDSDEGRAQAAAITALMTGHSYAVSAKIAKKVGPFAGYHKDRDGMNNVLRMHREEVNKIDPSMAKLVGGGTMSIVNQTVPRALKALGYNRAQVEDIVNYIDIEKSIVGAPHLKAEHLPVFACSMGDNAIHYLGHVKMMAAVQPFLSGAISKTVNMPEEATIEDVEQLHLDAWKMGLKAVAIYRDNCKVAQPLSMAKKEGSEEKPAANAHTAETPEQVTAIAAANVAQSVGSNITAAAESLVPRGAVRRELPKIRNSKTFKFTVGDTRAYMTVGEYEDGTPGELFVSIAKMGSTLRGVMDAFAVSVSYGLQFGVPLKQYVRNFTNTSFAPYGATDDRDIRTASSIIDYIFRRLGKSYLSFDDQLEVGLASIDDMPEDQISLLEEVKQDVAVTTKAEQEITPDEPIKSMSASTQASPSVSQVTQPATKVVKDDSAPMCFNCGNVTQRAGTCYVCTACGSTTGCS
jgi:ribonucleoside-diphosphate reductase alpha chain